MLLLRRILLVAALMVGLAPAISFAAPPPPVPALPDTERRTSYSISGTTCACAVNFAIYGDSNDVDNWLEVWIAGVRYLSTDVSKGWVITSPTGPISTIPRPITDAVLTFNSVQTGAVQIVGARRPRRTTQFQENRGVAARDLNQAFTDVIAQMRESWDKTNDLTGRAIQGLPGESIATLPSATARASSFICWDPTGLIPLACAPGLGQGNVVGPNTSTNGHIALWSGTTGRILVDGGSPGTGTVTGPVSSTNNAFARWNGTLGLVLQDGPTIIPLANGGTNNNLTASNGGIAYSDASGIQILAGTATARQMLQSGASVAPAWSTATWPATTTANQLLYSSATNTVAGLASLASGTLVTDGSSVPSISQTLPAAVQGNITAVGTIATGIWNGTAIAVANGGTGCTVASGTCLDNITGFASTGYVKRTGAGTYTFNNPIPLADGGTNNNLTASNGGLFYSDASKAQILAGTGTAGQIPLSGSNAAPAWSTTTWPSTVTTNNILYASGSNAISGLATCNNGTIITSGAGIPSCSSTLPTAVQSNITQLGTIGAGVWNGTAITGSFIATNTVGNTNINQSAGPTLKGNPTASTANQQDFTIQGLANKPTPNANNDFLLLYDATSLSFKSVTPGQLVSGTTAGVSSLNGLTGGLSIVGGNGISVSAAGSNVTVTTPTILPVAGIRCGGMDIFQRGAGSSSSFAVSASTTAYTADGWYLATGGTQASTVNAVTGIAASSQFATQVVRNSGQTGTTIMRFACPLDVDEVAIIANQFVALSFTVKAGANWSPTSGTLTYTLYCGTGTVAAKRSGSAYTGETTPISSSTNLTPGGSATRVTVTSAGAVGSTCGQAEIQFNWLPTGTAGAADNFTIDKLQLEVVGSASQNASSYVTTPFKDRQRLAQAYFVKTFPYTTAPAQNTGTTNALAMAQGASTGLLSVIWSYPAGRMACPGPSITSYNPSATNANWRDATNAVDRTYSTVSSTDQFLVAEATGTVATSNMFVHITADCGI